MFTCFFPQQHIYIYIYIYVWAPAKTSDILEQLHQDIDTRFFHETLRNDRSDTKSDDFWYTCSPDFISNIKSSGTMRDTQNTMTISATSFRGCSRFSPLLIYIYIYVYIKPIFKIYVKQSAYLKENMFLRPIHERQGQTILAIDRKNVKLKSDIKFSTKPCNSNSHSTSVLWVSFYFAVEWKVSEMLCRIC